MSSSLSEAPAYKSLFVAVVIISLITDPWQYNDNNHIMHVCAEPVIPGAAPSALLGTVCADGEDAALLVGDLGWELDILGYLVIPPLSPWPQNGVQQAKACSVPMIKPHP